eukprot:m.282236 g.282236  ORF g.282236 m.282236 type:complete len:120 (+) comp40652_c1_seq23:260-619(+)
MTHKENWSLVKTEGGRAGYVPFAYLHILDPSVKGLPWLEGKEKLKSEADQPSLLPPKPYVSAYNREAAPAKQSSEKQQYYCDVWRDFNGPSPYRSHMNGKAHREEAEAKEYFDSTDGSR